MFIDVNPAPNLFDSVQPDLQQTMHDAVEACAKAGMKRVGFIGGKGRLTNFYEVDEEGRATYFRREMGRYGLDLRGLVYSDGLFTVENGRKLGEQFIRDHNGALPDAVIVSADIIAVGVLQAFNAVGVIVPRDISVISINNQARTAYVATVEHVLNRPERACARCDSHLGRCDCQQAHSTAACVPVDDAGSAR